MKISDNAIRIFGIGVSNFSNTEFIDLINEFAGSGEDKSVFYANIYTLNLLYSNNNFFEAMNKADIIINDGIGLRIAAFLQGKKIKRENINDLWPDAFNAWKKKRYKIFLLGGIGKVAETAAKKLTEQGYIITGYHPDKDVDNRSIIKNINDSKADILIVGMGHPKQEFWINRHRSSINIPIVIAVGALLSTLAGDRRQQSALMRRFHLEWLWRLLKDPGRLWKRYIIGIPLFYFRFLSNNKNRSSRGVKVS